MREISESERQDVMLRAGGICYYCGAEAEVIDRVTPYSWTGFNPGNNLVASCAICNLISGNKVFKDAEDKRRYISKQRDGRKWRHRIKSLERDSCCVMCEAGFTSDNPPATSILCTSCYSGYITPTTDSQKEGKTPQEGVHGANINGMRKGVEPTPANALEAISQDYAKKLLDLNQTKTWREISSLYDGINHATLRRYAYGSQVINEKHREILGLDSITRLSRTSEKLYDEIKEMRDAGASYRHIGETLLPEMMPAASKSVVYRFYEKRDEIKDSKVRKMLGLEELVNVPIGCVKGKYLGLKSPPRPHRVAIYTSAAHIENTLRSMRNHMTPDLLDEIKRRL